MANQMASGPAPGTGRRARRAASTPMVVVSSSWEATDRLPLPPPVPKTWATAERWRRRYGTYPAMLTMPLMVVAFPSS